MFVTQKDHEVEALALEQLEFYGFWLWNYTHNELASFDDDKCDAEHHAHMDKMIKCDICNQRREFCFLCSTPISEKKAMFLDSILFPGIHIDYEDMENGAKVRLSSAEIITHSYTSKLSDVQKTIPDTNLRYIVNTSLTTFDILKIEDAKFGSKNIQITSKKKATITLDLSMPFHLIANELENLYYKTNERLSLHFKDPQQFYGKDYGPQTSYRVMLKILKTFPKITFSASAHGSRALGFWLWDMTKKKQKLKTVAQAIGYLKSGEEFPKDTLRILGFSDSETTIFNRLCRQTATCTKNSEVCSIG